MTPKEYLLRAWQIEKRIDRLIDEREHIWARAEAVHSPVLSDMPKGRGTREWTDTVLELVDLCRTIDSEIRQLCRVKREVTEAIDSVEDMRYRRILELRYRSYKTWEQIAQETGYDERYIYKLHGRALLDVKIRKGRQ